MFKFHFLAARSERSENFAGYARLSLVKMEEEHHGKRQSRLEQLWGSFKQGLFGVLFLLSKETSSDQTLVLLGLNLLFPSKSKFGLEWTNSGFLIDLMQILCFPFFQFPGGHGDFFFFIVFFLFFLDIAMCFLGFPWNPALTSAFIQIANIFRIYSFFADSDNSTLLTIFILLLGILEFLFFVLFYCASIFAVAVAIFILNAVFVGWMFANNNFRYIWTLHLLRAVSCWLILSAFNSR